MKDVDTVTSTTTIKITTTTATTTATTTTATTTATTTNGRRWGNKKRRCHSKSKENTENPLIIKLMENLSARSSQQIKGLIMFNICFFSLQILTIESE